MTAPTVTPWRRYGHDRLYVSVDGRRLGYRDKATGVDHPEDPRDGELLTALVEEHLAEGGGHHRLGQQHYAK